MDLHHLVFIAWDIYVIQRFPCANLEFGFFIVLLELRFWLGTCRWSPNLSWPRG